MNTTARWRERTSGASYSPAGMVATSQPDAAAAGLRILSDGGSAVDAALAMAAALTVVEPCSNGLGGDAFALVWDPSEGLIGLNGSGRAPAAASAEELRGRGWSQMPERGWDTVTVPGAVRAWTDLHARFGRLPFDRVLADAIVFAERGHPVTPTVAASWATAARQHATLHGSEFTEWRRVFAPGARAPRAGETWSSPDHGATLRAIAASAGEDVYSGDLARRLVEASDAGGGCFTRDDLASHRSEWVQPISTLFRGHRVYEIPPAGQGVAVLEALGILDGLAVSPVEDADSIHHAIEAIKLALTDAHAYVADPAAVPVPTEGLLDPGFAATRRTQIGPFALDPQPGTPPGSNTVYLAAADASGMMVSFIQSNYAGFGSHVVVPGTGIALQNRGTGFSLHAGHPNELAGGKRPFHTIIPGFLATAEGATVGPFGVMGGRMQAQGHLQVLLNTLVAGDGPQAALDRPRWFWESGRSVVVEDPALVAPLRTRGHDARVADEASFFGRGQIIWRSTAGGYLGGSEPRCDGIVLGL